MNSRDIVALINADPSARRVFVGVFSRDDLPERVCARRRSAFVINTDKKTGPGEHWVSVFFNGKGSGEYFDSFGAPPLHKNITTFLSKNCRTYKHNSRMIQGMLSQSCGLFVVYFIMRKSRGFSLQRLLKPFSIFNPYINDSRVRNIVQRLRGGSTI